MDLHFPSLCSPGIEVWPELNHEFCFGRSGLCRFFLLLLFYFKLVISSKACSQVAKHLNLKLNWLGLGKFRQQWTRQSFGIFSVIQKRERTFLWTNLWTNKGHNGRNPYYIPFAFKACIVIFCLDKWYLFDLPCEDGACEAEPDTKN